MSKALSGIRVIDVSRLLTGPYCSMILADLGADVVKVEVPERGDDSRTFGPFINGESGYYMTFNRNKRSITLDLRKNEGQQVFCDLIKDADVLLENFAVGTMDKWGLSYEKLKEINPRLIFASITGFGQVGPYAKRVAFDAVAQAMGGLMSLTGDPDRPPLRVGTSLGDINAGIFASNAILAALFQREKNGRGQRIDISMHDCIFAILENAIVRFTMEHNIPTRIGSGHPSVAPYNVFTASDGYVIIACANEATWQRLCQAMKRTELPNDKRFNCNQQRSINSKQLDEIINAWTATLTVAELELILQQNSVPVAPVLSIDSLVADPHLRERNMLVEVDHPLCGKITIPGNPIKMELSPDTIECSAPLLGQHTDVVLKEIGYAPAKIEYLRQNKIL